MGKLDCTVQQKFCNNVNNWNFILIGVSFVWHNYYYMIISKWFIKGKNLWETLDYFRFFCNHKVLKKHLLVLKRSNGETFVLQFSFQCSIHWKQEMFFEFSSLLSNIGIYTVYLTELRININYWIQLEIHDN
jgi:hypothetical protein